jgi:DNA-binding NarL/FixJ family response regulator
MLARVLPKLSRSAKPERGFELSPREHQAPKMLAQGLRNQEIANELSLSLYTVRNDIQSIMIKMRVHSKMEAVANAVRDGVIEVSE